MRKKVIIIGTGPGGLAAGMIMSAKGYDVHLYEKDDRVGGRMKGFDLDGYRFTAGPTFLIYIDALKQVFNEAGAELDDYLSLKSIDPLYDLVLNDKTISPTRDKMAMKAHLESVAPNHIEAYYTHLEKQQTMFTRIRPLLSMPFNSRLSLLKPSVLKALPFTKPFVSAHTVLKRRFDDPNLVQAMGFQTKYLGMPPKDAPGVYTALSYLEHKHGIYYLEGGLSKINEAMADFITKKGGTFHFNTPVKRLLIRKNKAVGIQKEDDRVDMASIIINNTDFSYFATKLIKDKHKKKYKDRKINRMKHSMSTFMMYLGLDKTYQLAPHTYIFAKDYDDSLKAISKSHTIDENISVYIHNPSVIDSTLTDTKNHSAMTVLVPVPNTFSTIDWEAGQEAFIDRVIARIEAKTHIKDLKKHIVKQKIITPNDWEYDFNVYKGAVFSLSHTRSQMLHRRPHNNYTIKNVYLVGGGTHPGSSLPMIYQSAIITTKMITNT
ncbi:MAG: phytoene desaturase family protein [Bacillota bacterium]